MPQLHDSATVALKIILALSMIAPPFISPADSGTEASTDPSDLRGVALDLKSERMFVTDLAGTVYSAIPMEQIQNVAGGAGKPVRYHLPELACAA